MRFLQSYLEVRAGEQLRPLKTPDSFSLIEGVRGVPPATGMFLSPSLHPEVSRALLDLLAWISWAACPPPVGPGPSSQRSVKSGEVL